ncbi:MAG: CBS domain-containing protein [Candidatus Binatia bacterium]
MIVREHMEVELVPVSPTDSCERALAIMRAGSLDALPVLDHERLVGLVTELDIRRRAPLSARRGDDPDALLPHLKVSGVMTLAPAAVAPSAPLVEAAALMLERGLFALPVLERERLIGIVTVRGILSAFVDLAAGTPATRVAPLRAGATR